MPKLNENYLNLKESYLFSEIAHRVNAYVAANPDRKVIRLGIGDVTLPFGSEIITKLHEGVDALASADTFKGYGPDQGYEFLRSAIVDYYSQNNISIDADEVFVSDGAKSDTGNITDLFDRENVTQLEQAIEEELSSFEKQVLDLYLTGMGYQQIAKVLARDDKSTDNALQRIKTKLKRRLWNE